MQWLYMRIIILYATKWHRSAGFSKDFNSCVANQFYVDILPLLCSQSIFLLTFSLCCTPNQFYCWHSPSVVLPINSIVDIPPSVVFLMNSMLTLPVAFLINSIVDMLPLCSLIILLILLPLMCSQSILLLILLPLLLILLLLLCFSSILLLVLYPLLCSQSILLLVLLPLRPPSIVSPQSSSVCSTAYLSSHD